MRRVGGCSRTCGFGKGGEGVKRAHSGNDVGERIRPSAGS